MVYFDNAATTQKPQSVIDALSDYYSEYNSNIHRGIHFLAEKSTAAYEEVRNQLRDFIGASSSEEIIFTRGTTEGINLVASSFGDTFIKEGEQIKLLESDEKVLVCSVIVTAEYIVETTQQLESKLKEKVDHSLAERISMSAEQDIYHGVSH